MQFVRGFFVFNERITIYRFLSIFFWNLIFNEKKKIYYILIELKRYNVPDS